MYDIVLRYCGSIGWLGIVVDPNRNEELYRTGRHYLNPFEAFNQAQDWRVTQL